MPLSAIGKKLAHVVASPLPIGKLPAGNVLNISAATVAGSTMGRGYPFAIAIPAMTKYIVVVGLLEAKLPAL